ncbi:MAG TPA: YigZ family protein [Spirochaeta sp.]|nr:YigZ family protein [Spirochaeta sp.]
MLIPDGKSVFELIIKKSHFIAETSPVESPEAARLMLKQRRLEHPDAAHVVHAFITGDDRQYMGMSDDGEPSGTSGKPALEVLKGRGITNIMLTIVRYYGGTKLGTGGLVKAYSESAAGSLDRLKTRELIKYRAFTVSADYHFYQPLKAIIIEHDCRINNEDFGTAVDIDGYVPVSQAEEFIEAVREASSARAGIIVSSDILQV